MGNARPRRRAAHAAVRSTTLALPSVSTARPRHGRLLPAPLTALVLGAAGGGLALLGAIGPQSPSAEPAPTALTANAAVAPAALDPDHDQRAERASRSRQAVAPDPEPVPDAADAVVVPAKPAAAALPGCDGKAHDVTGYANGRLPDKVLCTLPGGADERLRADAALAFVRLAAAYQSAWGEPICLTDGYRTLGEQQQLRRLKRRYAARPGSSEHGWGLAVDLSCGIQSFRSPRHAWMVAHAGTHGWFLPEWAQRGGSRPEPWHWEFAGT